MQLLLTLLANWRTWAIAGYLVLGAGWTIQTVRLGVAKAHGEAVEARAAAFATQVRVQGEAAQEALKQAQKRDKLTKDKADAKSRADTALLRQRIASLRYDRDHSGSYSLPAPTPAAGSAGDTVCFDRAEFSGAGGVLLGRLREIADEGDKATLDLEVAKSWAKR